MQTIAQQTTKYLLALLVCFPLFVLSMKCFAYLFDKDLNSLLRYSFLGESYPPDQFSNLVHNFGILRLKAVGYQLVTTIIFLIIIMIIFRDLRKLVFVALLAAFSILVFKTKIFDFSWSTIYRAVSLPMTNNNITIFLLTNAIILFIAFAFSLLLLRKWLKSMSMKYTRAAQS